MTQIKYGEDLLSKQYITMATKSLHTFNVEWEEVKGGHGNLLLHDLRRKEAEQCLIRRQLGSG